MNKSKTSKTLSIFLSLLLLFQQTGLAQVVSSIDLSGKLASLRQSFTPEARYRPLHLRYLSYDGLNNNFKLLVDKGSDKNFRALELENASKDLLKYFFIGLALPNDTFWVNLRPDSPDQIIDPLLEKTDIGRILLEADVELKKDTALATSPDTKEGKEYWDRLYQKAGELFGTTEVTIPTLTRPWIVPDEVIISESSDSAYIYKATLKVMLEEDYLKTSNAPGMTSNLYNFDDDRLKELNVYSTKLIKELILPKITLSINTGKKYASLRQVYYSLILAQWFKSKLKNNSYSDLIDSKDLSNLESTTPYSKDTYFKAYQKSFRDGEYKFEVPTPTPQGQAIRSYFSGGAQLGEAFKVAVEVPTNRNRSSILGKAGMFLLPLVAFIGVNIANPAELTVKAEKIIPERVENVTPGQVSRNTVTTIRKIYDSAISTMPLTSEEKKTFETYRRSPEQLKRSNPELFNKITNHIQNALDQKIKDAEVPATSAQQQAVDKAGKILRGFLSSNKLPYNQPRVVFLPAGVLGAEIAGGTYPFYPSTIFISSTGFQGDLAATVLHEGLHRNVPGFDPDVFNNPYFGAFTGSGFGVFEEGMIELLTRDLAATNGVPASKEFLVSESRLVEQVIERLVANSKDLEPLTHDQARNLLVRSYLTGDTNEITRILGYVRPGDEGMEARMKPIGLRDPTNEDEDPSLRSRQGEFSKLPTSSIYTGPMSGKKFRIVEADLGEYGSGAYRFGDTIVLNNAYGAKIQEEALSHEDREEYWMSRGFSARDAHIIAWAEQAREGVTPYQEAQLQNPAVRQAVLQEEEAARKRHYAVVEQAIAKGAKLTIAGVKDREREFIERARQIEAQAGRQAKAEVLAGNIKKEKKGVRKDKKEGLIAEAAASGDAFLPKLLNGRIAAFKEKVGSLEGLSSLGAGRIIDLPACRIRGKRAFMVALNSGLTHAANAIVFVNSITGKIENIYLGSPSKVSAKVALFRALTGRQTEPNLNGEDFIELNSGLDIEHKEYVKQLTDAIMGVLVNKARIREMMKKAKGGKAKVDKDEWQLLMGPRALSILRALKELKDKYKNALHIWRAIDYYLNSPVAGGFKLCNGVLYLKAKDVEGGHYRPWDNSIFLLVRYSNVDGSTFIHEVAHHIFYNLTPEQREKVIGHFGNKFGFMARLLGAATGKGIGSSAGPVRFGKTSAESLYSFYLEMIYASGKREIPDGMINEVFAYVIQRILTGRSTHDVPVTQEDIAFLIDLGVLPEGLRAHTRELVAKDEVEVTEEDFWGAVERFEHDPWRGVKLSQFLLSGTEEQPSGSAEEDEADAFFENLNRFIVKQVETRIVKDTKEGLPALDSIGQDKFGKDYPQLEARIQAPDFGRQSYIEPYKIGEAPYPIIESIFASSARLFVIQYREELLKEFRREVRSGQNAYKGVGTADVSDPNTRRAIYDSALRTLLLRGKLPFMKGKLSQEQIERIMAAFWPYQEGLYGNYFAKRNDARKSWEQSIEDALVKVMLDFFGPRAQEKAEARKRAEKGLAVLYQRRLRQIKEKYDNPLLAGEYQKQLRLLNEEFKGVLDRSGRVRNEAFAKIWEAHRTQSEDETGDIGEPDADGVYRHSTLSQGTKTRKILILKRSGLFTNDQIQALGDYGAMGSEGEGKGDAGALLARLSAGVREKLADPDRLKITWSIQELDELHAVFGDVDVAGAARLAGFAITPVKKKGKVANAGSAVPAASVAMSGLNSITDWIGNDLLDTFKALNNGKPVKFITVSGAYGIQDELEQKLANIDDDEYVAVAMHIDFRGVPGAKNRVDHRIVIDKARRLKNSSTQLLTGAFRIGELEFILDVNYYPEQNSVHFDKVGLGSVYYKQLQGRSLMSETFGKFVVNLTNAYPGKEITTAALSDVVVHWFEKYFGAHRASWEEVKQLNEYVGVDGDNADTVWIGKIPVRDGAAVRREDGAAPAGNRQEGAKRKRGTGHDRSGFGFIKGALNTEEREALDRFGRLLSGYGLSDDEVKSLANALVRIKEGGLSQRELGQDEGGLFTKEDVANILAGQPFDIPRFMQRIRAAQDTYMKFKDKKGRYYFASKPALMHTLIFRKLIPFSWAEFMMNSARLSLKDTLFILEEQADPMGRCTEVMKNRAEIIKSSMDKNGKPAITFGDATYLAVYNKDTSGIMAEVMENRAKILDVSKDKAGNPTLSPGEATYIASHFIDPLNKCAEILENRAKILDASKDKDGNPVLGLWDATYLAIYNPNSLGKLAEILDIRAKILEASKDKSGKPTLSSKDAIYLAIVCLDPLAKLEAAKIVYKSIEDVLGPSDKFTMYYIARRSVAAIAIRLSKYGVDGDKIREILKPVVDYEKLESEAGYQGGEAALDAEGEEADLGITSGDSAGSGAEGPVSARPSRVVGRLQGLFVVQYKTRFIYVNRGDIRGHLGDFAQVLGKDKPTEDEVLRYLDGHETLHALIDKLRSQDNPLSEINGDEEERLAEIFGRAFSIWSGNVDYGLIDEVRAIEAALKTPLLETLNSMPQGLQKLLDSLGISVEIRTATPDEMALFAAKVRERGGSVKEADIGGRALPAQMRPLEKLSWDDSDAAEVLMYFRALPAVIGLACRMRNISFEELSSIGKDRELTPYQLFRRIADPMMLLVPDRNTPTARNLFEIISDNRESTSWFRYPGQLQRIISAVREIVQKQAGRPLVIREYASAGGENAYSMAVALKESFPEREFDIEGIDAEVQDPGQLNFVSEVYIPEELDASWDKYFDVIIPNILGYKIFALKPEFKDLVRLQRKDIKELRSEEGGIDIMVVNGLLGGYIEGAELEDVLESICAKLAPGGRLLVDNTFFTRDAPRVEFFRAVELLVASGRLIRVEEEYAFGVYMKPVPAPRLRSEPGDATLDSVPSVGRTDEAGMAEELARNEAQAKAKRLADFLKQGMGTMVPKQGGSHFYINYYPKYNLYEKNTKISAAMESVRLARARLGGLTAGMIVAEENGNMRILTEGVALLKDVLEEKMRAGEIDAAKALLRERYLLDLAMIRRGVVNWDAKLDNYGINSSGDVVLLDFGGLSKAQDVLDQADVPDSDIDFINSTKSRFIPAGLRDYNNKLMDELGFKNGSAIYKTIGDNKDKDVPKPVEWFPVAVKADEGGEEPGRGASAVPAPGGINSQASKPGGIDFRSMPIVSRAMANLSASAAGLNMGQLKRVDLDKEWSDIEQLVSSGIAPSGERIKEYLQASSAKGELGDDIDKVLSCISEVLRMDEERCCASDEVLKDVLIVLEASRSPAELTDVLVGAGVS